ncbi:MAG TPA: bacillithiol system redox-active protein YtxJ [Chitinophagaceae bacterium]|nr:bacillithiol system redox-active protein YtxJ [Chitinophagaceae bacterium]
MQWLQLESEEQLASLLEKSIKRPQVIFKHSTRCSVSSVIKNRLEKSAIPGHIDFHYLDLIRYRSLSNKIAEDLGVWHESPQVLLIQNGHCIFDESHLAIYMEDIVTEAPSVNSQ